MKTLLTTLFSLSALAAALSIVALFTAEAQISDYGVAAFFFAMTIALYLLARWYLIRFGRIGLLKPKLFRREPRGNALKAQTTISSAGWITDSLSAVMRKRNGVDLDIHTLVRLEIAKIKEVGLHGKARTFEEILTETLLLRFVETDNRDRSKPPISILRQVRDTKDFWRLREMVDEHYAKSAAKGAAYRAWEDAVGDVDQSHLLKDGWIPFLKSLPGPDINLWHGVATDFHEISEDRLDAAFWIVEQDACDRTTASEFIMGFLQARMDIGIYDPDGTRGRLPPDPRLERFVGVINLYNDGFYKFHSLNAGVFSAVNLEDQVANDLLTNNEKYTGLSGLPRPRKIVKEGEKPVHSGPRGYDSPYAYWDEAGLHLKYPGDDWQKTG
ncbi:hypothetical protein KQ247_09230 [Ruegeria pomeroyi]|nr:hypothetical protein [Ruegeria pomeroyi]NVK96510.1 hypothetical protein [Ruegeria pomeroyi]NVL02044.1 hypothetical protein [Ruegeria pomeroyi]QWV10741.1 hypothetical protein KQ247_09230 [Ruegeria pomeroyi]HCE72800.1 hypothetical protein [Ruegeria sp.]